ncbi:3-hydroxyacyl-dehydrogenase [Cordyceps militaris]|uniref:3-hydroxyacyl-dehydrogenase n=1 Tax=Cordyceps militaris TaxID=73501 RepID=A0A2H4SG96_CORMI|nr:3-hydroxyacyl-dehydrogenase [Cordyceps militaris]
MKISKHTFLVSGGASGLGRACCEDIVAQGGHVAVLDQNEENGQEFVKTLGSAAQFFVCDVLESESIAKAVQGTVEWANQSGKTIGGAITAAGVALPAPLTLEEIVNRHGTPFSIDDFDFVVGVNLRGTIDLARQTCEAMVKTKRESADSDHGVIIMVASSAAFDGQNGQVSYSASKGAIRSLTLPMARDLGRYGIRAMTIAPSLFETGMTSAMPDKVRKNLENTFVFPTRSGRAPEFASLVRQIIENEMLNGEVIRLDGASRMPKI